MTDDGVAGGQEEIRADRESPEFRTVALNDAVVAEPDDITRARHYAHVDLAAGIRFNGNRSGRRIVGVVIQQRAPWLIAHGGTIDADVGIRIRDGSKRLVRAENDPAGAK